MFGRDDFCVTLCFCFVDAFKVECAERHFAVTEVLENKTKIKICLFQTCFKFKNGSNLFENCFKLVTNIFSNNTIFQTCFKLVLDVF